MTTGTTAGNSGAFAEGRSRTYTVIWDGDCRVCGRLVRGLARWDSEGRLELVSSQQQGVRARFPWIPERAYAESLQLVRSDGRTWQGAAAIEELLRVIPRGRWFSWIFRIPFARPVAERMYRWFARNRYHLGCVDHCRPTPPAVPGEG